MTRWLTPAEQVVWRAWLESSLLLQEQLGRELMAQSGISMPDYELLVQLSETPERRLRMSDLATRSQSSRSRLSHAIARLEDLGWVRREQCETDRRGAWAVLTDKGFSVIEAAAPGHVESVRTHLFDQLSDDQVAALGDVCSTLLRHLEAQEGAERRFTPRVPSA